MADPAMAVPFRFLDLHLEIRRLVYDLFNEKATIYDSEVDGATSIYGPPQSVRVAAPRPYHPLLQINQQIRHEYEDQFEHWQQSLGSAYYHYSTVYDNVLPSLEPTLFAVEPHLIVTADVSTCFDNNTPDSEYMVIDFRSWLESINTWRSSMTNLKNLSVEFWLVGTYCQAWLLKQDTCLFEALEDIVASTEPLLKSLKVSIGPWYKDLPTYSIRWADGRWSSDSHRRPKTPSHMART